MLYIYVLALCMLTWRSEVNPGYLSLLSSQSSYESVFIEKLPLSWNTEEAVLLEQKIVIVSHWPPTPSSTKLSTEGVEMTEPGCRELGGRQEGPRSYAYLKIYIYVLCENICLHIGCALCMYLAPQETRRWCQIPWN